MVAGWRDYTAKAVARFTFPEESFCVLLESVEEVSSILHLGLASSGHAHDNKCLRRSLTKSFFSYSKILPYVHRI